MINKVYEFRVEDDRRLSSPPPFPPTPPVWKLCEPGKGRNGKSFRPTLKGYCFGYREFALFPPTSLIVRSFLNVAFSVTNSSSLRVARCICAGVISDAIECRRFSAPNLFNVSHSAGSLYTLARMRTCHNAANPYRVVARDLSSKVDLQNQIL